MSEGEISLTKQDLQNIENIVDRKIAFLDRKISDLPTKADLKAALVRSEDRIVTAMGLLERDVFDRFENHEKRIARLEKKLGN
jgi:hypothetical protein